MKIAKPAVTPEFRDLAVKRGKAGESVGGMAKQLGLVEQTLRNWVKAAAKGTPNRAGSPMVTPEERERSRLRAENGIHAHHKRRDKVTTASRHALPVAENRLACQFTPTAPNQLRTSDIRYLWTDEGWRSLAIVLDLFNRKVVGGSLKPRMTANTVTDALTMAWFRRRPAPGLIPHSDRGSQYASHAFQDKLEEYGMVCSMNRQGNSWDNAPTESGLNRFQTDFIVCDHSPLASAKGGLSRSTAPPQPDPVGQIPHDGEVAPPAFVGPAAGDVGRPHLLPLCQAPRPIRIGPCTASISPIIFSLPCRR